MSEHSHAERLSRRIELSAEELSLLLGPDRFAPVPAHEATVQDVDPEEVQQHAEPIATASAPAEALALPTGAPRLIGDTDLVQAILSGAPNFEQLALRAIRERTGEELARIISGSAADAMVATGTATMIGEGRAFVAPLAPDARAAWALWLQRWLELAALTGSRAPRGLWDDPTGFPSWPRLRQQVAHRIAAARLRRESLHVALLRIEDAELWNRRAQILLDNAFMARIATALDSSVVPGDELARLDDGGFVLVSLRESAPQELAAALKAEISRLPGDGPRSLVVHLGVAVAPWDATDPDSLLELASRRAASHSNQV